MTRVLVIDDDQFVHATLRDILEDADHEVFEAADGEQGLRALRVNVADVVITDILMPEKEGIETIAELRRIYPNIKIIAMSGGGRSAKVDFLEIAARLGADLTLYKPVLPDSLLKAIEQILQGMS